MALDRLQAQLEIMHAADSAPQFKPIEKTSLQYVADARYLENTR
jgi:hypothetical protein